MTPAAGGVSPSDRLPMLMPVNGQKAPGMISETFAKDAIIAWFRGEFALCTHLTQLEGGNAKDYESAFAAIHRRRLNWIPILQMQKFYSIADVSKELRAVVEAKAEKEEKQEMKSLVEMKDLGNGGGEVSHSSQANATLGFTKLKFTGKLI